LLLIPLEALNVDPRRITHWLDGTRAVPAGVWTDIKMLAEQRKAEIDELEAYLFCDKVQEMKDVTIQNNRRN
jgi:hypothetical protein